jgi:60S ribosome subunit biogenesis protein NIP7
MQASEDWLAECENAVKEIDMLLGCLGVERRLGDPGLRVVCRPGPRGVLDVYAAANRVAETVLALAPELRLSVSSVGIHVARMRRGRLIPFLGLCSIIARYRLRPRQGYVVVKPQGEKLFLYGRDVLPESIAEYRPMPGGRCRGYPVLVLNERAEPLGWGRPRRGHDRIYIENVIDAAGTLGAGCKGSNAARRGHLRASRVHSPGKGHWRGHRYHQRGGGTQGRHIRPQGPLRAAPGHSRGGSATTRSRESCQRDGRGRGEGGRDTT